MPVSRMLDRCTRRSGLIRVVSSLATLPLLGAAGAAASGRDRSGEHAQAGAEGQRRRRRSSVPEICQRIIVPAYFGPGATWARAVASAPSTGLMILNVNSGVGDQYQEPEALAARAAQAAGITVLGYVQTNLARRPVAEVEAEIDKYFDWYGVDGIYIDVATGRASDRAYFRRLADHTRAVDGGATVALNPALDLDRGYLEFVDVYCLYEWTYEEYREKQLPEWIGDYPAERFIHVVYAVPSGRAARATLNLAKRRNAGYVFLTNVSDPDRIYKSLGRFWDLQVAHACP